MLLVMLHVAAPAQALRIRNCTDQTHEMVVDYYGEKQQLTLPPYTTRQFYGRPREIIKGDQTLFLMQYDNEYCIREGGKLSLQRRNYNDRRGR